MNKELLAATALFGEMVNEDIDLNKILNDFILSVFKLESVFLAESTKISDLLKKHHHIEIPNSIVKRRLKVLEKSGKLEKSENLYYVSDSEEYNQKKLQTNLNKLKENHDEIFSDLIKYIEYHKGRQSQSQIDKINNSFINFLFDKNFFCEYTDLINRFIVKKSETNQSEKLNFIRQGMIAIKGLRYQDDSSIVKKWRLPLTIFLDTEHLFDILGYNGEVHKKILLEFYHIVRAINKEHKNIILKYFPEASDEVKNYFKVAISIKKGETSLKTAKSAMKHILSDCDSVSQILTRKTDFFTKLNSMGITESDSVIIPDSKFKQYNVENQDILNKYLKEDKNGSNEEDIIKVMKLFTDINFLRKGMNDNNIENIKYVLLSGKSLTNSISQDIESKFRDKDFSFSSNIDYVTQRFWYKLNKSIGLYQKAPITLDVVTKAQIVLANSINSALSSKFNELSKDVEEGKKTEEDVKNIYFTYREFSSNPEDLTAQNIEEKTNFLITDDEFKNHIENQELLKSELNELREYKKTNENNKKLKEEAKEKERIKKRKENIEKHNLRCKKENSVYKIGYKILYCFLVALILYILYIKFNSNELTALGLGFAIFLSSFTKLFKKIDSSIDRYTDKKIEKYEGKNT